MFKHYDDRRDIKLMHNEQNDEHLMWEETKFTEPEEKNRKEIE